LNEGLCIRQDKALETKGFCFVPAALMRLLVHRNNLELCARFRNGAEQLFRLIQQSAVLGRKDDTAGEQ
jgi:hypothetical protein